MQTQKMHRYYKHESMLSIRAAVDELLKDRRVDRKSINFGRNASGQPYLEWDETMPMPQNSYVNHTIHSRY